MNAVIAGILTFVAILSGALSGVWMARRLPEDHLSSESRTAVSVSMAVVGTLSALVMGLLLSNASASFSARADAVHNLAIDIIRLDRALDRYGPEASPIRQLLQSYAQTKTQGLAVHSSSAGLDYPSLATFEDMSAKVYELRPGTGREHVTKEQAIKLLDGIASARWTLIEKSDGALPMPFFGILILWLALLFGSFGLFAPPNATVVVILLLCGAAISGGVFMILELGTATEGLVRVSIKPMFNAIRELSSRP